MGGWAEPVSSGPEGKAHLALWTRADSSQAGREPAFLGFETVPTTFEKQTSEIPPLNKMNTGLWWKVKKIFKKGKLLYCVLTTKKLLLSIF